MARKAELNMNKRFSGNIKGSTTLAMEVLEFWGLQFVKTHAVLNADDNTARSVTVARAGARDRWWLSPPHRRG